MKNKKSFNKREIFLALVIIVLVCLLTCNKKKQPVTEPIKTVAEQKAEIKVDSIASKHYNDSVAMKEKQASKEGEMWFNEWKASEQRYADLEKGISEFTQQPVPDTCKELQQQYTTQLLKLSKENKQKDIACEKTIASKNGVISQQAVLIKSKNSEVGKLRAFLDTAFAQQTKLSKSLKQLNPKNSIYIGATALGNENKFINGYGVNLGLRNKKGTMWEVGALQIGSTINYTIGVKKTLFNF